MGPAFSLFDVKVAITGRKTAELSGDGKMAFFVDGNPAVVVSENTKSAYVMRKALPLTMEAKKFLVTSLNAIGSWVDPELVAPAVKLAAASGEVKLGDVTVLVEPESVEKA